MSKIFTANRVAAISTWLTSFGALIASIQGTLPKSWQNTALGVTGVVGLVVTALHFMSGAQKYDALTTPYPGIAQPIAPAPAAIEQAVAVLPDPAPVPAVAAPVPPPVA